MPVTTYQILNPGDLPPGITFDGIATISGTPTVAGSYSFEVKKLIDGVPQVTWPVDFVVDDCSPTTPPLPCVCTIRGVTDGEEPVGDFSYSPPGSPGLLGVPVPGVTYTATGGVGTVAGVPPGCTLNAGTGTVQGGCTTAGTYTTQIFENLVLVASITWIIDSSPGASTPSCFTKYTATYNSTSCSWGATIAPDGSLYGVPPNIAINTWMPDPDSAPCGAIYIASSDPPYYGFGFVGNACGALDNGAPCSYPAPSPTVEETYPNGFPYYCECVGANWNYSEYGSGNIVRTFYPNAIAGGYAMAKSVRVYANDSDPDTAGLASSVSIDGGSPIYGSCNGYGSPYGSSSDFSIPAGTTSVEVTILGGCAGGANMPPWEIGTIPP